MRIGGNGKMKFYVMQSEINPSGYQSFFKVYFNKKKLIKALSALGMLYDWRYMRNHEWDTDDAGLIAEYFYEHNWKFKIEAGWSIDNIAW